MKKIFAFAFILIAFKLNAQIGPDLYLIEFADKNNTPYTLNNPQEYLSERAINRRNAQNIAIDSLDLPVNASYIEALVDLGLEIHNVSKWMNSAVVRTDNYSLVLQARNLPFVKSESRFEIDTVQNRGRSRGNSLEKSSKRPTNMNKIISDISIEPKLDMLDYGFSYLQFTMHNGQLLHEDGYMGEGMLIAVIDGGFYKADIMPSLARLRDNNKIIATRDFSYGDGNVYDHHTHGSMVLSIMAGYDPGRLIGTAPEADYLLITSENGEYEELVEEFNWISAIEYADSMGADMANVSLGYVDFDSERYNHAYEDMNGQTCPSSIGAEIAASRGMLVFVAAGNSGNDENGHVWIGAPCDAENVIAVAAVRFNENTAPFTSHGICTENRIKPDVASDGWGTIVDYVGDSITTGNGTSFATPVMCGLTACFWQKFRDKTSAEIRNILLESTRPTHPRDEEDITCTTGFPNIYVGRGIVDFAVASENLTGTKAALPDYIDINIFPNPTSDSVTISINPDKSMCVNIFSLDGRLMDYRKNISGTFKYDFGKYANGEYVISFSIDNKVVKTESIVKR